MHRVVNLCDNSGVRRGGGAQGRIQRLMQWGLQQGLHLVPSCHALLAAVININGGFHKDHFDSNFIIYCIHLLMQIPKHLPWHLFYKFFCISIYL